MLRTLIRSGYSRFLSAGLLVLLCCGSLKVSADDSSKSNSPALVPLDLKLPAPVFAGTPKEAPRGVDVEPTPDKPPPPLMVPADVRNIAPGKKITCSDKGVSGATLAKLTD